MLARVARTRPLVREAQQRFSGGLNTAADDINLGPNELRQANEATLDIYGGVAKRLGSRNTSAAALGAPSPVRGIFCWQRASGVQYLGVANGTLYTSPGGALPWTWTAVAAGPHFSNTAQISFAAFRDGSAEVVYIADGGLLNKWDGAALTLDIAGTPNLVRIWVYNQRLHGVIGTNETIHWSGLNNGDSCGNAGAGGGASVVRTFGDRYITTGMTLRASSVMFHVSGISRFTGISLDDISIQAGAQGITSDTGTIYPSSVISLENEGFFLSDRGFYRVTEGGVEPISLSITPTIRAMDTTAAARVVVGHNRALYEVWWYLPDLGVLRYNYALRAWSGPCAGGYIDPVTYTLCEAVDADNNPIVLCGTADGFVKWCDYPATYRDNVLADGTGGDAYTFIARLKRMFWNDPTVQKSLSHLEIIATLRGSSGAGLLVVTDSGTYQYTFPSVGGAFWGSFSWGSFTWAGASSRGYRVPVRGRGIYADIYLIDDGTVGSLWSRVEGQAYNLQRP